MSLSCLCGLHSHFPFSCILKSVLPFYNLNPQCYVAWQERQGLQSTKPLLNIHTYWVACNVPHSTIALSLMIPNTGENKSQYVRTVACLPQLQLGYATM